jgi:hypothetical protein
MSSLGRRGLRLRTRVRRNPINDHPDYRLRHPNYGAGPGSRWTVQLPREHYPRSELDE